MEKEFEKLIKKNQAKWLNLLNKFTPNYCDAEDVLQDTLIRALRYLPKYDPTRAGMNTWFHKIMFSELKNWYRKNNKNRKNLSIEFWDELIDHSSLVEDRCSLYMLIKNNKNEKERKILTLMYIYGYNMEDTSSILNVSEGKISNTTTKFKQQFKEE